jgi:hypothetical protein
LSFKMETIGYDVFLHPKHGYGHAVTVHMIDVCKVLFIHDEEGSKIPREQPAIEGTPPTSTGILDIIDS